MNINKNFKYLFLSTIATRLLSSLVFYLLSVYFDKSLFGDFIWCFTIVNYFSMLADLGLDLVGMRQFTERNGDLTVVNNIFSSKILLSILSFIACVTFTYFSSFSEIQKNFIFLFSLQILVLPFQFSWYYSAIMNFKIQAYCSLIQNFVYLLLVYVFNYFDLVDYLPLTFVLSFIIPSLILHLNFKKHYPKTSFIIINFRRTMMDSLALGSSRIFTAMYASFDVLFIGLLLNSVQVSDYSVAFKIASVFLIPCISLSGVFQPKMISSIKQITEYIENRMDMTNSMLIFSFLTTIFLIFNSASLLHLLYDYKYNNSILLLSLLACRVFFVHFSYTFSIICVALNKDMRILRNTVAILVSNILLSFTLIKIYSIEGAAYAAILTEIVSMILYYFSIDSNYKVGKWFSLPKEFFISLLFIIGISIVINFLDLTYIIKLIINGFLFIGYLIYLRWRNIYNILRFL